MNADDRSSGARRRSPIRAWLPALAILAASFGGLAWMEVQPQDEHFVAAVFPPWWSAARSTEAVVAADGTLISWGGLSSIILTQSDREDFAARLYAAGAMLLLDPTRLTSCTGRSPTKIITAGGSRR